MSYFDDINIAIEDHVRARGHQTTQVKAGRLVDGDLDGRAARRAASVQTSVVPIDFGSCQLSSINKRYQSFAS
ncbi:unnamed protein product [Cylicocyclus nassatus]|uniref:Uncharacterized protein n=1 Tax=Cylicocyclus nassatus TaxID=53992 RepID=A0AA36MH18_CYLNA|nr:unnamed protein product [Cylicocyclus nassatus]